MPKGTKRLKHKNFLFLNVTPSEATKSWKRVLTSTDFAIGMNAVTESLDFIADESPTESLTGYNPSIAQTQHAYIGDPVYDYVEILRFNRAVGTDAMTDYMLVHQDRNTDDEQIAEMGSATIVIDSDDMVAGTITYSISTNGTPSRGHAEIGADGNPIFTPEVTP